LRTMNVADVKVPRKEALAIMEQVRPKLVQHLVDGMDREQANALVIEQLSAAGNCLSPYAHYVVTNLVVEDGEIEMRRKYGNKFTDDYVAVMNAMRTTKTV